MDENGTKTLPNTNNNNSSEEFWFEVPLVKSENEVQVNIEPLVSTDNINRAMIVDEYETKLSLTNTQKTMMQYNSKDVTVSDEITTLSVINVIKLNVKKTDSEVISVLEECEPANEIKINGKNHGDTANKHKATSEAVTAVNDNNHNTISATVNESNPEVIDLEDGIINVENVVILDSDKKEQENVVILDSNQTDSDVILLDGNKTDSGSTIVLDDDEISKAANPISEFINKDTDCSIIGTITMKRKTSEHNTLFKEHSLLAELVEKCLDMENVGGMTRVINRTLIPIYKNMKEDYKNSDAMRKVITKTIMMLDVEPERKFSHIKNMCDEFKQHIVKKRLPFITLEDKVSTDTQSTSSPIKKRKIDTIIDLDDEDTDSVNHNGRINTQGPEHRNNPKEYAPIEIDDDSSSGVEVNDDDGDVIIIGENDKENTKKISRSKHHGTKRKKKNRKWAHTKNNAFTKFTNQNCKNQNNIARFHNDITNHHSNIVNVEQLHNEIVRNRYPSQDNVSENTRLPSTSDPETLLQPSISVKVGRNTAELNKIQELETKIAELKVKLEEFEEKEVTGDNLMSPYLICEQIKSYILKLYERLCELTGAEVTKRHEVRLQVVPGHPEGPVRCLEEFLNSNIDVDGNPPFPDLYDVIGCVSKANFLYKMNWGSKEIMDEARALFTQYGRSMQKRRQKREYKDLMSLVKEEAPDPAECDPELQARLEFNKQIALRNEHAIFDRYSQMENVVPDPGLRLSMQQEDSDDNSEPENGSHTSLVVTQIRSLNPTGACEETTDLVPDQVTSMNQVEPRSNFIHGGVSNMNQVQPRPNCIRGGVGISSHTALAVTQIRSLNPTGACEGTTDLVPDQVTSMNQVEPRSNFIHGGVSNMNQVQPRPNCIRGGVGISSHTTPVVTQIRSLNPTGACEKTTNLVPSRLTSMNQVEPRPNFIPGGVSNMNQVQFNERPSESISGITSRMQNVYQTQPFVRIQAININPGQHFVRIPGTNQVQQPILGGMNYFQPVVGINNMNLIQSISGVIIPMNQLVPSTSVNQTESINRDIINVNKLAHGGGIMSMNQAAPRGVDMNVQKVVSAGGNQGESIGPIRVNNPESSDMSLDNNAGLVMGSSLTVAGGKIVIQPTLRYTNDATPEHACSEISMFTGEYNSFLNKKANKTQTFRPKPHYVQHMTDSATISRQIKSIRLENEKKNATALAKDLINLIKKVPSDNTNGFANVVISNVQSVISPTKRASQASNESDNDNTQTDRLKKTTHTEKIFLTVNENTETFIEDVATSESQNITHLDRDTDLDTAESMIKPESLLEKSDQITDPDAAEDTSQADDRTTEERSESIVKPEPLDIPSMLEELGDDYTTTIFDIEDPFLVIEISDSSESEEDEKYL